MTLSFIKIPTERINEMLAHKCTHSVWSDHAHITHEHDPLILLSTMWRAANPHKLTWTIQKHIATTCRCYLIPHNSYDFLRINRVNGSIVTFLRSSGLYKQNPEQVVCLCVFFSLAFRSIQITSRFKVVTHRYTHNCIEFITFITYEWATESLFMLFMIMLSLCRFVSVTLDHSRWNMIDHNYDYADECWRIETHTKYIW